MTRWMWVDLQMLKTSCRGISRDTESLGFDPCICHQVMMCSTNLEILRLSDNHVNEQGFCELLHGLQHSTSTLRQLDLHDVPFIEFSNYLNVAHRLEITLAPTPAFGGWASATTRWNQTVYMLSPGHCKSTPR